MASSIKLMLIPGISEEDTILFNSFTEQFNFFGNYQGLTLEDGFYPPHYTNVITAEVNLIQRDTFVYIEKAYNYAMLIYENKHYYYFIYKIEYVNESLVNFYIKMDTIQTYMYEIGFIQSHISRLSIKRWNGAINRNYIREQISDGIFRENSIKFYNKNTSFSSATTTDIITGVIICKSKPENNRGATTVTVPGFNTKHYCSAYKYQVYFLCDGEIPHETVVWCFDTDDIHDHTAFHDAVPIYQKSFAQYIQNDASLIQVYFIPFNPFKNVRAIRTTYVDSSSVSHPCIKIQYKHSEFYLGQTYFEMIIQNFDNTNPTVINTLTDSTSLLSSFTAPSTPYQLFDYHNCPALIDESYISIGFGETGALSSFPLHKLTDTNAFNFKYTPDIFTGQRVYYINGVTDYISDIGSGNNVGVYDPLGTARYTTNMLTYDIVTDAFNEWYTYNKAAGAINIGAGIAGLLAKMLF